MKTNIVKDLYHIPVNTALIDSFSLKIPLDSVKVLDTRLTSQTCIYYETLDEIDSELHPPKPIVITQKGVTIRFSLAQIPIYNQKTKEKTPTEFLVLTVSSKLLGSQYFEGINSQNIETLHKTFLNFEVFSCSLQTFLQGQISDIDICVNMYSDLLIFQEVCNSLFIMADYRNKHLKLFNDPEQLGLMFNKRAWAKPSLPFIKAYHKELELKNRSAEFAENYLQGYEENIKNLTRVEATIKNYAHKTRLEKYKIIPKFKTLEDFLQIPQENLYSFISFSLNSYVLKKARLKAPELKPTDHLIYELIQNSIVLGLDLSDILTIADTFQGKTPEVTEVAQSRLRKKIKDLHSLLIDKEGQITAKKLHNKHVIEYLKQLRIDY